MIPIHNAHAIAKHIISDFDHSVRNASGFSLNANCMIYRVGRRIWLIVTDDVGCVLSEPVNQEFRHRRMLIVDKANVPGPYHEQFH